MPLTQSYQFRGHNLEVPLFNAAGALNGDNPEVLIQEGNVLGRTDVAALEYGSFTVHPQPGNEKTYGGPTFDYDPQSGETYNSMGLPNIGMRAAVELAPQIAARAHDLGKIVIYSCSPTNSPDGESSVQQAVRLVSAFLGTGVDLIELNVSCPNIVTSKGRKPILGYDLEAMHELFDSLEAETKGGQDRLGIKLPPYLTEEQQKAIMADAEESLSKLDVPQILQQEEMAPDIADLLLGRDVFSFLVACNTILCDVPLRNGRPVIKAPGGRAGKSGPATKEIGREQLSMWHELVGGKLEIVSALGVDSGGEMLKRLELGAAAVSGVTFLWRRGNWANAVSTMLAQYADAQQEV
jgi:dihydroorotate dehydrogenase